MGIMKAIEWKWKAREVQAIKKCHRAEAKSPAELPSNDLPLSGTHQQVGFLIQEPPSSLMFICVHQAGKATVDYEDLDKSLAERRTRRGHHWLPKRYQDIAPEAPAALLPTLQIIMVSTQAELNAPHSLSLSPSLAPVSLVRKTLKSSHNMFGLFHQYYMTGFLDHNPGEHIQLNDLHTSTPLVRNYSPYPNQSMFLLGEWYWNGGEKKSQSSFQNLIKIVGHLDFHLEMSGEQLRTTQSEVCLHLLHSGVASSSILRWIHQRSFLSMMLSASWWLRHLFYRQG